METLSANCVCGCDSPWVDPSDELYLDTHFECEGCGSDFPVRSDLVREVWSTHEGTESVYFCRKCHTQ
jgi:hypothetical protein